MTGVKIFFWLFVFPVKSEARSIYGRKSRSFVFLIWILKKGWSIKITWQKESLQSVRKCINYRETQWNFWIAFTDLLQVWQQTWNDSYLQDFMGFFSSCLFLFMCSWRVGEKMESPEFVLFFLVNKKGRGEQWSQGYIQGFIAMIDLGNLSS